MLFYCETSFFPMQEMYHAHTTEELLQQKVSAIVDCYLHSSVPPWLQLDIPQAIADQVVKKQQGPYIFREAQVNTCIEAAVYAFPYVLTSTLNYV